MSDKDKEKQEQKYDLEQLLLKYGEARNISNDAIVLLTYLRQQLEAQEIVVKHSLRRQRKIERVINDLKQQMKKPDDLKVEFYVKKNRNKDRDDE